MIDKRNATALLHAYQTVRPIEQAERDAWLTLLRAAGLRFWLSRLQDKHFPRNGEMTHIKDPDVYKRIIEFRASSQPDEWLEIWQH